MHNRTASIHLHGHMPEPQGSSTNDPCMIHGKEGDWGDGWGRDRGDTAAGVLLCENKSAAGFYAGRFLCCCDSDLSKKKKIVIGVRGLCGWRSLQYLLVPALRLLCGAPPRWCSNCFPEKLHCLEGGRSGERVREEIINRRRALRPADANEREQRRRVIWR